MRFGGLVASYCNLYGTQAGWTESSLQYRDPEHGGMTWTSQYADSKGIQYTDAGEIPERTEVGDTFFLGRIIDMYGYIADRGSSPYCKDQCFKLKFIFSGIVESLHIDFM